MFDLFFPVTSLLVSVIAHLFFIVFGISITVESACNFVRKYRTFNKYIHQYGKAIFQQHLKTEWHPLWSLWPDFSEVFIFCLFDAFVVLFSVHNILLQFQMFLDICWG